MGADITMDVEETVVEAYCDPESSHVVKCFPFRSIFVAVSPQVFMMSHLRLPRECRFR